MLTIHDTKFTIFYYMYNFFDILNYQINYQALKIVLIIVF